MPGILPLPGSQSSLEIIHKLYFRNQGTLAELKSKKGRTFSKQKQGVTAKHNKRVLNPEQSAGMNYLG